MKDEGLPVSADEFVLRLIWTSFYQPSRVVPVSDRAFMPRASETDGISVFRVACLNDPMDVLTVIAPEKREKYGLARLAVAELMAIGLSVQPAKIEALPGHAVIPELNFTACTANPVKCLEFQKQIAVLAARNLTPPSDQSKS